MTPRGPGGRPGGQAGDGAGVEGRNDDLSSQGHDLGGKQARRAGELGVPSGLRFPGPPEP